LVSVRSAEEALAALAGGADLIDVKEPKLGSLGAATSQVWQEVAAAIGTARPLSAALGELFAFEPVSPMALQGYRYAKLGLSDCVQRFDWRDRWHAALATLPPWISPVAVVYADHETAGAPPPEEILRSGRAFGCRTLLVDTFDKQRGDVFAEMGREGIANLFAEARGYGTQVVLAGSLRLSCLPQVVDLSPDYIAIRGAVCRPTRAGALNQDLVREWADFLVFPAGIARQAR
jgi:uncharacterized protein (UPF0264 family)